MSATGAGASASILGTFDRETIDGTEYLVHDVVAQKEGVYYYPDGQGGVIREFVSADELKGAIEETDEEPTLLRHPDADKGPELTINPRANFTEVGKWSDFRPTDDGKGIAGKVYVRANEVGGHDGDLRRYLKKVAEFGAAEVSTGYDIGRAESYSGRHNGKAYDAEQKGLNLDHLALLPDEPGDCSVEDGCGLGRANQEGGDSAVRVNNHFPENTEQVKLDGEMSLYSRFGQMVSDIFNIDIDELETMPAESGKVNNIPRGSEEQAEELVEEYGYDRQNIVPLIGSQCLHRIHEAVVSNDSQNMGDDNPENGGSDEEFTDEQWDRINNEIEETVEDTVEETVDETVNETVNEAVPSAEEIASEVEVPEVEISAEDLDQEAIVEQVTAEVTEQVHEARAHEENVELIAESDELPQFDMERANNLDEDLAEELAEDVRTNSSEDNEETEGRSNFAGRPTNSSFDPSEYDSEDGPDVAPTGDYSPGGDN